MRALCAELGFRNGRRALRAVVVGAGPLSVTPDLRRVAEGPLGSRKQPEGLLELVLLLV